jgi:hypothetical protein
MIVIELKGELLSAKEKASSNIASWTPEMKQAAAERARQRRKNQCQEQ